MGANLSTSPLSMDRRAVLAAMAAASLPAVARAARPAGPPMHDNNRDGRAMAPDGSRFILPVAFQRANEMLLLNTDRPDVLRLVSANEGLTLLHPAFTPDGGAIVVVASPLTVGRSLCAGELWRVDLGTGATDVIGEVRGYCYPSISPDGARLAYWKGVDAPMTGMAHWELAPIRNWGLFERDLASGKETRLLAQDFDTVGPIFHDPLARGLFTTVGPTADQPRIITLVRPGAESSGRLSSFLPLDALGDGGAELSGVTADGHAFFVWGRTEGGGVRMSGCFSDGRKVEEAFTPGAYGAQHMICSGDGQTFVAVRDDLDGMPQRRQTLYVQRPGKGLIILRLNGIHGTRLPMVLAPQGSRLG